MTVYPLDDARTNDTSFASTFAAVQTAIITGAGSSHFLDIVRKRLQMRTGKPMALGKSSATHRRPLLRRGRRHHGDSMSESCLGALVPMREALYAEVSAAHTVPRESSCSGLGPQI